MIEKKYISSEKCLDFIEECVYLEKAIIGFEQFKKEEDLMIPQIDCIADFSSILQTGKSWKSIVKSCSSACKNILLKSLIQPEIYYEFVVLEKTEWKAKNI